MRGFKVYFSPVSCTKANVDLEKISWSIRARGFEIADDPGGASVGIIFGCAFTDDAKRESIDDILTCVGLKKQGCLEHLIVTGCLPQKYGEDLSESIPEVDAFVGNTCLEMLPVIIERLAEGRLSARIWTGGKFGGCDQDYRRCAPRHAPWTRSVLICDGCDNSCTYCSIPHMRGSLRSREISDLLEEVRFLVGQGAKEIVLAGQDTASFGADTGGSRLCDLVARVAIQRDAPHWIRLSYVNPDNVEPDIAEVIRDHKNVCNYIDMPIQHASLKILSSMGRKSEPEAIADKIQALRTVVPDIAIRTSVIVGFPGEDEKDFECLLDFLCRVEFDMVGVFAFSPQPGTVAAEYRGRIPDSIKQERVVEVVCLQDRISRARMERLVGRQVEVLVEESTREGTALGRSQYDMAEVDRTIRLRDCKAPPGDFVTARIEKVAADYEWSAACVPWHRISCSSTVL